MPDKSDKSGGTSKIIQDAIETEYDSLALLPHSSYAIRVGTFFNYGVGVSRSQIGTSFVYLGNASKGYTVRGSAIRKDRFPFLPIITSWMNIPKRTFVESVGEPGGQGTVWTASARAIVFSMPSANNTPLSLNDFANKKFGGGGSGSEDGDSKSNSDNNSNNDSSKSTLGVAAAYAEAGLIFGPPSIVAAANIHWIASTIEIVDRLRDIILALSPAGLTKIDRVE